MSGALDADNETPLFLLNPPIPADEYREKLWGSLVLNPYKPIDNYSSCDKRSPAGMITTINTKPQPIKNYGEIIKWSRRGGVDATVESVFKAYFGASQAAIDFRRATSATWYYMEAKKKRLGELCANEEWKRDVLEFIRENPGKELFFVTAALVVQPLEMGRAQLSVKEGGVGISVPNPHDGSNIVSVGAELGTEEGRGVVATFVEPQIFALGYHSVKITEEVAEQQKRSFKSRIRKLLGLKPKYATHLVGTLHDIEAEKYYRLNMNGSMQVGNIKFLDDDSDDEKEEEPIDGQLLYQVNKKTIPARENETEGEQSEGILGGKIAIYYLSNDSTEQEKQQAQ